MIRMKITPPKAIFDSVRDLPRRSRQQFQRELQTVVKPNLQTEVKDLIGREPGPVVHPFQFSTDKSRRAYFATRGFGKGIPYQRTHDLVNSWFVDLQLGTGTIVIFNAKRYGKYVYGSPTQLQVPGHLKTGWGRDFPAALQLITEYGIEQILDAWGRAVNVAAKER